MSTGFTHHSSDSIWCIETENNDPVKALEYLNNPANFRSFSDGLTELILKYGYKDSPEDPGAKTSFVLSSLSSAGRAVSRSTVRDWFTDKRRPSLASGSRTLMFQLCFALSVTLADVNWFFHHVYFDRCFNCHTIEEAVYYYCFSNCLSYSKARQLLAVIDNYPVPQTDPAASSVFTKDIRTRLDRCASEQELLDFFRENKAVFTRRNQSALAYIDHYVSLIQGKRADKAFIKAFRAGKPILPEDRNSCGLVVQEYLFNRKNDRLDYISGKNITSIDFMLERIILTNTGFPKNTDIPDIVKTNFPSKKTFSDILNKSETSTSYDSIRKCLILLKFYHFWASLLLEPSLIAHDAFDIFQEETDALLISCGYEKLFSGHPYDWLFLWASTASQPLEALRNAVSTLENNT